MSQDLSQENRELEAPFAENKLELERMFSKKYIREQIKFNRLKSLLEQARPVPYFQRLIEEINARSYSGLLALSYEFGLSLSFLDKILERKAPEIFKLEQMPKSCEISALRLMLSPGAADKGLIDFSTEREVDDKDVRRLYFLAFAPHSEERLIELIEQLGLASMLDYIWKEGLSKFLHQRYRVLAGEQESERPVEEIVEKAGLSALFDENKVIKHYADIKMAEGSTTEDLKEKLSLENTLKAEASEKLNRIFEILGEDSLDTRLLKRKMLDLHMDTEVAAIEHEGISSLKEYIRSKGLLGAHEVALRYDFVYPSVSGSDMYRARNIIRNSFFTQAQKTPKGKIFIRSEVLYNLRLSVKSGECFQLPGGYLLSIIHTVDQDEHYLFGRYPSRLERDGFNLLTIGCFNYFESPIEAVTQIVKFYMDKMAPDIRWRNALKKMIIALPIVLSLSVLVGAVYYLTLGIPGEAFLLASGIMLVGMAISGKNGYDEEITPASHEKIPEYMVRKGGKIMTVALDLDSQIQNQPDLLRKIQSD